MTRLGRRAAALVASGLLLVTVAACSSSTPDRTTVRFGSLDSPCGPGDATGATDVGVTDTTVRIGFGDDAGSTSSPGLNREMSATMRAMIEWCNAQGGLNGRRLEGTYYDAAVNGIEDVWRQACESEFFMVGQGYVLDDRQEAVRLSCGLPTVPGFALAPAVASAPLLVHAAPAGADALDPLGAELFARRFPTEVNRAAAVVPDSPDGAIRFETFVADSSAEGWQWTQCAPTYRVAGATEWDVIVASLMSCAPEVVRVFGVVGSELDLLLAAAERAGLATNWSVDPPIDARTLPTVFPGPVFTTLAVSSIVASERNVAADDLRSILGGPDEIEILAVHSASAFLRWAVAADACGSELTRTCVLERLGEPRQWTAGGLHGPVDPRGRVESVCGFLAGLEPGAITRVDPAEIGAYDCWTRSR